LLTRLPALPPAPRTDGESFLANARAGLGFIWSTPTIRVIGLGFFAVVAFSGIDDVAMVFLAKDTLGGGDSAAALLYAGVGIGLVLGYALLTRYGARFRTLVLLVLGFAVSSAGNLLTGLAWAISAALLLQIIRGLGIAALDVAISTHLQRVVPAAMRGRVFGNLYGAVGVAAGVSYGLGALVLELTSPRITFVAAGTGGLLATAVMAIGLWRTSRHRTSPEPDTTA
jgi:MFS family permease